MDKNAAFVEQVEEVARQWAALVETSSDTQDRAVRAIAYVLGIDERHHGEVKNRMLDEEMWQIENIAYSSWGSASGLTDFEALLREKLRRMQEEEEIYFSDIFARRYMEHSYYTLV